MARIRVLEIITSLAPGGAERLLLDMIPRFSTSVFDIKIVSLSDDLRALNVYSAEGLPVHVFELKGVAATLSLVRLREFLRQWKPDIIHAHMYHAAVVSILLARTLGHRPMICFTSHTENISGLRKATLRALARWRHADVILRAGQHPKINAKHTEIIPNGVRVPLHTAPRKEWSPGGDVKLVAVGRLVDVKDPLGLVQAFASLNLPELTMDFVGAGPLEGEAKRLVEALGLSSRVRFLGLRQDARDLLRQADIFVMHSKTEGMPMALLEAGAEAMPVVATPVGAIPGLLADERGWAVPPDDFVATLRAVVARPHEAIKNGARLKQYILDNHSLDHIVSLHGALYEKLVAIRRNTAK